MSIYSEDMPSMDNHWVDQVDELLKMPVFDDGSNRKWRYGKPASNDVNIWRTLNSDIPFDLKPPRQLLRYTETHLSCMNG